jgi:hypothetical protein
MRVFAEGPEHVLSGIAGEGRREHADISERTLEGIYFNEAHKLS